MNVDPVIVFDGVGKTFSLALHLAGGVKGLLLQPRRALQRMHAARRECLRDISFEIARGESVAIIGRNGVGKSTILSLIAGVLAPTSGRVSVRGRVSPLLELGAGFHPELSGRDNILLNGVLLGMRRAEVRRKAADIIAFAELEDSIDEPIRVYSSGMLARLGFAVAVHLDPEILLVDESLAVGDERFQQKCIRQIGDLHSRGVTTVLVSHDLLSVSLLCQRALVLEAQKIAYSGPVEDAIRFYKSGNSQ
ncbi:MAG: ABC transporter ATP-binding protein [Casimicrobiaceae bacterium]